MAKINKTIKNKYCACEASHHSLLMGLQIGAAIEISVKDTQKAKNKSTL